MADTRPWTSILAVSRNGVIGRKNTMPWRLKSDLQFFKKTTSGQSVIMGRRTYNSLGGCLPNRINIVVTHDFAMLSSEGACKGACGIPEAVRMAQKTPITKGIFVIGGAMIYTQFQDLVENYLVTEIDAEFDDGDTFVDTTFLSDNNEWHRTVLFKEDRDPAAGNDFSFSVVRYEANDKARVRERRNELLERAFGDRFIRPSTRLSRPSGDFETKQTAFI